MEVLQLRNQIPIGGPARRAMALGSCLSIQIDQHDERAARESVSYVIPRVFGIPLRYAPD